MKKIFITAIAIALTTTFYAQVGVGTTSPHASAALDVESITKGFLPPRMTQVQIEAINSPAEGLIVYCYDCVGGKGLYVNTTEGESDWNPIGATTTASENSDDVLAQIGLEGDNPDTVDSEVTIAQLNQILPALTGVDSDNETAYQDYIDANPDDFSSPATKAEVQAMVDAVNTAAVLAQIGLEGDNPDTVDSVVTIAQLNQILPALTGVDSDNETAYQDYIDANPDDFSSPATKAEVQTMIDAVNAAAASDDVLAQIGLEGDDPDTVDSEVTIAQLNQILPALTGVDSDNETAYQDYIDANPDAFSSPATQAEVQAMIDAVNNPPGSLPGNATCSGATISATNCTTGELSSGIGTNPEGGTYDVVNIGDQCWMAENIVKTSTSPTWVNNSDEGWFGYYNNTFQDDKEGTLFQWSGAMNGSTAERAQGVCPTGWHVPSDCEWMFLENTLGMSTADQEKTSWRGTDEGTQLKVSGTSGFEGILAGYRFYGGNFTDRGADALYWSSSVSGIYAYSRGLSPGLATVLRLTYNKAYAWNVRCLKD